MKLLLLLCFSVFCEHSNGAYHIDLFVSQFDALLRLKPTLLSTQINMKTILRTEKIYWSAFPHMSMKRQNRKHGNENCLYAFYLQESSINKNNLHRFSTCLLTFDSGLGIGDVERKAIRKSIQCITVPVERKAYSIQSLLLEAMKFKNSIDTHQKTLTKRNVILNAIFRKSNIAFFSMLFIPFVILFLTFIMQSGSFLFFTAMTMLGHRTVTLVDGDGYFI